jgi:hypothetical protein
MNMLDSAMQALTLAFHRAGAAALDPANAPYTGGLFVAVAVIVVLMRRSVGRPGSI